jgi:PAS domain S-box-containing protein
MEVELRDSGIDVIGNVPWGTHFCQFYKTKQDLIDILVPYFRAGLENNEFCMWVTSEPLVMAEAKQVMREAVSGFDEYLRLGQMEIIPYNELYLLGGSFDDGRVLDGWVSKLEQALARGYSGLRLTSNTFRLERNHWQAFREYETKINDVIGKYQMMAVCTYSLDKCDGAAFIDAVKNHQFALVKQEGKWGIIVSSIYSQARGVLLRNQETIAKQIDRMAHILNSMVDGIYIVNEGYEVEFANSVIKSQFGAIEGRKCYQYLNGRTEVCPWCKSDAVFSEGKRVSWEWYSERTDRTYDMMEVPLKNIDGSVSKVVVLHDITNRKHAGQALFESDQDLKRAQAVAHTGSWRLDILHDRLLWSDETYKIFGIPVGTPMTYEAFLSAVHSDDREYVNQRWTAALRGEPYDIEHRIVANETVKWVSEKAELEFDARGDLRGGFGTVQDITERKRTEEELTRLNRELRAITDCNQVIVRAEDEETLFNDICRIMCEDVGYAMSWVGTVEHDKARTVRPAAWYGGENGYLRKVKITWADTELGRGPTGIAARTGKTDFCQDFVSDPKAAPWRDEALARGFRSSIAIPLFDNDGSVFAVFSLYASEPNGFTPQEVRLLEELAGDLSFGVGALRTREEHREAEESLRETRDYLDNLINYANAPIIVWNPRLEIARFNHAFERLTGYSADEVLGGKVEMLFPDDSHDESMNRIGEATSGEPWEVVEIPVKHKTGSVHILLWNSATIYAADGRTPLGTIAQGQDITERKKVEQMKDEFIGLISHELRTPLTVINGSLQTAMSEGVSQDDVRELLRNAAEGAESLGVILENMLELSRHQAGRLQLRNEPVSIAGVARNVAEKLKRQGFNHQVTMRFPQKLPEVRADPVRVERVLLNLLENAAKYSPEDSKITVTSRTEDDFVVTSVVDHGVGISEDDQTRIFERFQRLGTSQRWTKGVGLGLVVCKRLVEAQGGWIKVDSQVGKGSTFSFALPIHSKT